MAIKKSFLVETVRVCLNSTSYQKPSGGYKAHSNNVKGANSHECGIGMEEWINSPINVLTAEKLNSLGIEVPEEEIEYRIAFIEAYKIENYPPAGSKTGKFPKIPRSYLRDVDLVINNAPSSYKKVGEIKNLRGLSQQETNAIFQQFLATNVISQMDADIAACPRHRSARPLNSISTFRPEDAFSCIFPVRDAKIFCFCGDQARCNTCQPSNVHASRYRWRY